METDIQIDGAYKVNLDMFEGPLDLLLYLIKKDDLDITDIPIAKITEAYLQYLDAMKDLNVNVAGEFLLMAAELIQIKSKMLLPSDSAGEEDPLEEDPRGDLMRRLLEYQRYKEAAIDLFAGRILNRDEFVPLMPERLPGRPEILADESVFKLLEAFQQLVRKMPSDRIQEVTLDRISVNERMMQLVEFIKVNETVPLEKLLPENCAKYELVITFLALLEMAKLAMIKVYQAGQFQTLYITGRLEQVNQEEALKLVSEEVTTEGDIYNG